MIVLKQKQQIILRHMDGDSNRQIAKDLNIDKNTVNKYVKEYDEKLKALLAEDPDTDAEELISAIVERPVYDTTNRHPAASTESAKNIIAYCLQENERKRQNGMSKQQMRLTDIHRYLSEQGITISYSTVKRLAGKLDHRSNEAFIKQVYEPGQVCEFDWGEVKLNIGDSGYHRYQMAAFSSAYGNYRFAKLYRAQDTAAFLEAHVAFFDFCKGVYHTITYDNMKVAVKKMVGFTEKEPTEEMVKLSTYYRFNYRFCNIRSGNEKGHVERSVDAIRRYAFSGPGSDTFETLKEANDFLLNKVIKKNNEPLSDGRVPAKTFEEEKPYLMDNLPPYPCFIKRIKLRVDKYSTVSVNKVHYSVPDRYTEKYVDVRIYTDKVVFYHNGDIIAEHPRCYEKGSYRIDIYHYLHTLKKKPGALAHSTALQQADIRIKKIFDDYYTSDPKKFLPVFEIIRKKGVEPVADAITKLLKISPLDLSADKINIILENCDHAEQQTTSHLDDKIKQTLSQYDRLKELMNTAERMAV